MNVLVDMFIIPFHARIGWGKVGISGVDFGCFSTFNGDCEALDEREEQVNFTLFLCPCPMKPQVATSVV